MVFGTPPSNLRHVALHEEAIDVLVREPSSALVDGLRAFAKGKGCNAIVLRDDDITPLAEINQRDIHRVSPGANHLDFAVIGGQDVIGVT